MKNKILALLLGISILPWSCVTANAAETVSAVSTTAIKEAAEYNMVAGSTVHVLPRYTEAAGTSYTYTSSNTNVCTVDYKGNVTAVAEGSTTIIVKRIIESANSTNTNAVTATLTPTNITQAKEDGEENAVASKKARDTVFTAMSLDDALATATPTAAEKVIEGWGLTETPTPTPTLTPIPTETEKITITPAITSMQNVGSVSGNGASGTAASKTSVVSYAVYKINVFPLMINCEKDQVGVGDTLQLATNVANNVTWTVGSNDDYNGATDYGTGTVLDLKIGNAETKKLIVSAKLNGATASKEISVVEKSESQIAAEKSANKKVLKYIKKNGFSFNDSTNELAVGDSILFATNVDHITGSSVKWTTTDSSIITVSSKGLVTALAAGSAKLKATCNGNTITKKITVVEEPVLKFTDKTDTIAEGDTFTFSTNKGAGVTWASENPNIATVDKGKVTGVAMGVTKIHATYGDATLVKTIEVTGDTTLMRIISSDNVVHVGEMIAIETNRANATFSVNNSNVAIINKNTGILTGKTPGTVIVTAKAGNEKVRYTVTVSKGTSDLAFIGLKDNYSVGEHLNVSTNKKGTSYISTNTSVASINQNTGAIDMLSPGVTMIYAFNGVEQISKQITVSALSKDAIFSNLVIGDTVKLETNDTNASWSTSNQAVATIDATTGELTAVGEGKCLIYKYSDESISYIEVCVNKTAYTEAQAKEISKLNNYIKSLLLEEDGETLRSISQSNVDTILPHLRTIRAQLAVCEDAGIAVTSLPYYTYYDAALNQYLLSAHSYNDGKMITLEEGKQIALTAIDSAIMKLITITDKAEIIATIDIIDDMIVAAQEQYLISVSEIDSYETLSDYRAIANSTDDENETVNVN